MRFACFAEALLIRRGMLLPFSILETILKLEPRTGLYSVDLNFYIIRNEVCKFEVILKLRRNKQLHTKFLFPESVCKRIEDFRQSCFS